MTVLRNMGVETRRLGKIYKENAKGSRETSIMPRGGIPEARRLAAADRANMTCSCKEILTSATKQDAWQQIGLGRKLCLNTIDINNKVTHLATNRARWHDML